MRSTYHLLSQKFYSLHSIIYSYSTTTCHSYNREHKLPKSKLIFRDLHTEGLKREFLLTPRRHSGPKESYKMKYNNNNYASCGEVWPIAPKSPEAADVKYVPRLRSLDPGKDLCGGNGTWPARITPAIKVCWKDVTSSKCSYSMWTCRKTIRLDWISAVKAWRGLLLCYSMLWITSYRRSKTSRKDPDLMGR